MKTILLSPNDQTINELLQQADSEAVLLQAADGRRFVLTEIDDWQAFDVGDSDDFAAEVAATSANEDIVNFLRERRKEAATLSLAEVRAQLGLPQE